MSGDAPPKGSCRAKGGSEESQADSARSLSPALIYVCLASSAAAADPRPRFALRSLCQPLAFALGGWRCVWVRVCVRVCRGRNIEASPTPPQPLQPPNHKQLGLSRAHHPRRAPGRPRKENLPLKCASKQPLCSLAHLTQLRLTFVWTPPCASHAKGKIHRRRLWNPCLWGRGQRRSPPFPRAASQLEAFPSPQSRGGGEQGGGRGRGWRGAEPLCKAKVGEGAFVGSAPYLWCCLARPPSGEGLQSCARLASSRTSLDHLQWQGSWWVQGGGELLFKDSAQGGREEEGE